MHLNLPWANPSTVTPSYQQFSFFKSSRQPACCCSRTPTHPDQALSRKYAKHNKQGAAEAPAAAVAHPATTAATAAAAAIRRAAAGAASPASASGTALIQTLGSVVYGLQLLQDLDSSDLIPQELQQVKVQLRGPGRLQQEIDRLNQQADAAMKSGEVSGYRKPWLGPRSAEWWEQQHQDQQQQQQTGGNSIGFSSKTDTRSKARRNGFWTVPLHYAASTPVDAKWQAAHSAAAAAPPPPPPAAAGGGRRERYNGSDKGLLADSLQGASMGGTGSPASVNSRSFRGSVTSKVSGSLEELLLLAEVAEAAAAAESEEQSNGSEPSEEPARFLAAPSVGAATSPSFTAAETAAVAGGRREGVSSMDDPGTVVEVSWLIPPASLTSSADAPAKLLQDQQQLRLYRRHQQLFRSMSPSLRRAGEEVSSRSSVRAGLNEPTTAVAAAPPAPASGPALAAAGMPAEWRGHGRGVASKGVWNAASREQLEQLPPGLAGAVVRGNGSLVLRGSKREESLQGMSSADIGVGTGGRGCFDVRVTSVQGACGVGDLQDKRQEHKSMFSHQQQQQQFGSRQQQQHRSVPVKEEQGLQRGQQQQPQHYGMPSSDLKRRYHNPEDQERKLSVSTEEVLISSLEEGAVGAEGEWEWEWEWVRLKKQRLQQKPQEPQEQQQQQEGRQQGDGGAGQWRAIEQAVADALKHSRRHLHSRHACDLALVS